MENQKLIVGFWNSDFKITPLRKILFTVKHHKSTQSFIPPFEIRHSKLLQMFQK